MREDTQPEHACAEMVDEQLPPRWPGAWLPWEWRGRVRRGRFCEERCERGDTCDAVGEHAVQLAHEPRGHRGAYRSKRRSVFEHRDSPDVLRAAEIVGDQHRELRERDAFDHAETSYTQDAAHPRTSGRARSSGRSGAHDPAAHRTDSPRRGRIADELEHV